ncbi:hypothetical protein LMG28727_05796 [Paraburkholderia kirstenboschensis]|jgi:hypothetical protein|nr:hypothetical protein LMG28727_05796 [Paraburkholderia kirstenboschensis]
MRHCLRELFAMAVRNRHTTLSLDTSNKSAI